MSNLRKRILEELQRRNYSPSTVRGCLHAVEQWLNTSENPQTGWGQTTTGAIRPICSRSANLPWEAW